MDFFALLGHGSKFDKKRFDIQKFEKRGPIGNLEEIDYFGQNTKIEKNDISIDSDSRSKSELKGSAASISTISNPEEAKVWRNEKNIKVYGTDIPLPFKSFEELCDKFKFKSYLKRNLLNCGFDAPTPIQMQAIPIMLHGRDVMSCSPTGSGKTLAFLVPILHDLKGPTKEGFRAVIISPTRELSQQVNRYFNQINRELEKLSTGKPFKVCVLSKTTNILNRNVADSLKHFDILISTPLRLVNAIKEGAIALDKVHHLILDEADKLLELGFLDQVDEIFAACTGSNIQKSLFSATITSGVETLGKSFMSDPLRIVIGHKNAATDTINQKLLFVGQEQGKLIAIRQLVQQGLKPPCLIFVQSIERAKELFHELVYDGINVDVIHGDRTQMQRDNIIKNFRLGKIWVLIATEILGRGIDFKGVNMVINYDFPQTIQSYIHRIGRTGRAGRKGEAITYFTKEDAPYLKSIVNVMKDSGCDVPEWMLNLKKPTNNMKKNLKQRPLARETINTATKFDEKAKKRKREMIDGSKNEKAKLESRQNKSEIAKQ